LSLRSIKHDATKKYGGREMWKVAGNVFNEKARTVEKELVSCLGIGLGITIPHLKKCYF
jgi:hypothetical protein